MNNKNIKYRIDGFIYEEDKMTENKRFEVIKQGIFGKSSVRILKWNIFSLI